MRAIVYEWKIQKYAIDAQDAGEELMRIQKKHGIITPEIVVNESQNKEAVLHSLFTWDTVEAAKKQRLQEARAIINNIVAVEIQGRKLLSPARGFISVKTEKKSQSYTPIVEVLSKAELNQQMLDNALRELQSFRKKYQSLLELTDLFSIIDGLESKYQ